MVQAECCDSGGWWGQPVGIAAEAALSGPEVTHGCRAVLLHSTARHDRPGQQADADDAERFAAAASAAHAKVGAAKHPPTPLAPQGQVLEPPQKAQRSTMKADDLSAVPHAEALVEQ